MKDSLLLRAYRALPYFKGKLRLGKLFFKRFVNIAQEFEFVAHDGIRYRVPNTIENLGLELLINGVYEKSVVDFLKSKINDGDTYFDIGANIGSIGLPVVKARQRVRYYGFEASPATFQYLQENFAGNKITGYQLYNHLIHENDGSQMKFYQSDYYGKSSLAPTYSNTAVTVESVSLTRFCDKNGISFIDWMKIDVQGFELYVIKGMRELLLDKRIKNILFEFEDWAEDEAKLAKGEAQRLLASLGYQMFDMKGRLLPQIVTEGSCMIWAKPNA